MISLKHLLMLMGSVSLLMTIAVVVVKVNHPGHISLAEVRAIDRLCHRFADDMLEEIYQRDAQDKAQDKAKDEPQDESQGKSQGKSQVSSRSQVSPEIQAERLEELHTCMVSCRDYLISSRSKVLSETDRAQLEVPACFGAKLTKLVEDARSAQPQRAPSSAQED